MMLHFPKILDEQALFSQKVSLGMFYKILFIYASAASAVYLKHAFKEI